MLSSMQKKWAVGGAIGALALAVGYALGHRSTSMQGALLLSPRALEHSRRLHAHEHEEHARGEYGHHRHKAHKHG